MTWIDAPVVGERVALCPLSERHTNLVRRLRVDPIVRAHLGGPRPTDESFSAEVLADRWGAWAIEHREPIGLLSLDRARGELEVSYELLPNWWGQGLAQDALRCALDWVWATCGDTHVVAVTQSRNERSIALLERCGFGRREALTEYEAEQTLFSLKRPVDD